VTDAWHELQAEIVDALLSTYRKTLAEFERAFIGDLDGWQPLGILPALGSEGVAVLSRAVAGPVRTDSDPTTLERRFAEALAELEGPIDRREYEGRFEPCAPPIEVEPFPIVPPVRWSRPPRMWP
jgi:hypothetical protein